VISLDVPPIRSDRQAGHCPVVTSQHSAVERCWADGKSILTSEVATECQSLADPRSPLGLCRRHQEEICG
jgi:hypothetical protein